MAHVSSLHAGKSASGAGEAPSLAKLLTTKSVVLGALIFVFQQFAGINAIIYFSSSVFAQVPFLLPNDVRARHTHFCRCSKCGQVA